MPAVSVVYFYAKKISPAIIFAASTMIFYAAWNVRYLPLLLASVAVNYFVSIKIANSSRRKTWLISGIIFNFVLLSYYKLNNFLPLGISFWTFTQVGYLIEVYRANVEALSLLNYFGEILFFPVITSGPILSFKTWGGGATRK